MQVAFSEHIFFTAKDEQQNRWLFQWKCCSFLQCFVSKMSYCDPLLYTLLSLDGRSQNLLYTVLIMCEPGAPRIVSTSWTAELLATLSTWYCSWVYPPSNKQWWGAEMEKTMSKRGGVFDFFKWRESFGTRFSFVFKKSWHHCSTPGKEGEQTRCCFP